MCLNPALAMEPLKLGTVRITFAEKWLGTNILQMVTEVTEIYICKCFDTDPKEKDKIRHTVRLPFIWKLIY
jgi:hypothetical protein